MSPELKLSIINDNINKLDINNNLDITKTNIFSLGIILIQIILLLYEKDLSNTKS